MQTIEKQNTTLNVVNRISIKRTVYYQNKENRDMAFKILKESDFLKDNNMIARKTSTTNQNIHPEYIEDYEGTIEIGFGNSMYQTLFNKLYKIEIRMRD